MARVNPNLVIVGGLAAGAYLLYRWLSGTVSRAAAATGAAFEQASSSTADVLETVFPHSIMNTVFAPGASIMLGDGSVIAASAPTGVGAFTDTDGVVKLQFYWQGRTYRTTAAQPDSAMMYYAASTTG
jgi:hypothetical protein